MDVSESYLSQAKQWMLITTLIYFLIIGAMLFESVVLLPIWTGNLPDSYRFLSNADRATLKAFWVVLHAMHELTFLLAIFFCWKFRKIRNVLIILFTLHVIIRIWTQNYFSNHLVIFQQINTALPLSEELYERIHSWKIIHYARLGAYMLISLLLLPVLLKLIRKKSNKDKPS